MNTNTTCNHIRRAKQKLRSIESSAKCFGQSLQQIIDAQQKVRNSLSKCPRWAREKVQGMMDIHFDNRYVHLEFCYVADDGTILSVQRDSERYYEKKGYTPAQLNKLVGSHYWKGTDKRYS